MKILLPDGVILHYSSEEGSDELKIFRSNEIFESQQKSSKILGNYVILALYGEASSYPKENLRNFHLPGTDKPSYRNIYLTLFENLFKQKFKANVAQIIIGHEHDIKGYCFLQVCIFFESDFKGIITPSSLVIESQKFPLFQGTKFYYVNQRIKSKSSLTNYLRKEGDFFYLDISKANVDNLTKKNNEKDSNLMNHNETCDSDSKTSTSYKRESKTLIIGQSFDEDDDDDDEHNESVLKEEEENEAFIPREDIFKRYHLIGKWFSQIDNPKKGLLLYSDLPFMGKKNFAYHLLKSTDKILIINKHFVIPKEKPTKQPKLVIISDLDSLPTDMDTFTDVISGKKNKLWNYEIPCIITTRNCSLFVQLYKNKQINQKLYFIEVKSYIGVPKTEEQLEEEEILKIQAYFTQATWESIDPKLIGNSAEESYLSQKRSRF